MATTFDSHLQNMVSWVLRIIPIRFVELTVSLTLKMFLTLQKGSLMSKKRVKHAYDTQCCPQSDVLFNNLPPCIERVSLIRRLGTDAEPVSWNID